MRIKSETSGKLAWVLAIFLMSLLIMTSVLSGHSSKPSQSDQRAALATVSRSTNPVGAVPAIMTEMLSASLQEQVAPIIHLYLSYPNTRGKQATLNQLSMLVSPEALADVELQWSGDMPSTASVSSVEVLQMQSSLLDERTARVMVEAFVTTNYVDQSEQTHLQTCWIDLDLRAEVWVVVRLKST